MEVAIEAGADDVQRIDDNKFEISCQPEQFSDLLESLEKAEIETEMTQITRIPNNTVDLDGESSKSVLKLMDALDDHDDVQSVSANFNIPQDVLAEISDQG